MRRIALMLAVVTLLSGAGPAMAERLVVSLSNHRVAVTSSFVGEELVLFGTIEPDPVTTPLRPPYDLVVTVTGPAPDPAHAAQGAHARYLGQRRFARILARAVLSCRAEQSARSTPSPTRTRCAACRSGSTIFCLPQRIGTDFADTVRDDPFRRAFVRLQTQQGLYRESATAVTFLTPTVFRAAIPMPAAVPTGSYANRR